MGTRQQTDISPEQLEYLQLCRSNPAVWCRTWLGWSPWSKQEEIGRAVLKYDHLAIPTCNAAGKSAFMARLAMWFATVHWPAVSITTAPTERQVKAIIWKEIKQAWADSRYPLGPEPSGSSWELRADQRVLGITAPEYDPVKFQGIRDEHTFIIVDEACGISPQIYEAIDGIRMGGATKLIEIGNPTDPNTPFAEHCADPHVHTIQISAYDTPNFTLLGITEEDVASGEWEEKVERWMAEHGRFPVPGLAQPSTAAELYRKHGPTGSEYLSRVKGEFPEQSEESVFPRAYVQWARKKVVPDAEVEGDDVVIAVDTARYGHDETVIGVRQGLKARIVARFSKRSTMETLGRAVMIYRMVAHEVENVVIRVDSTGLGESLADRLYELEIPAEEYRAAASPFDEENYRNVRAEAYFHLRDLMERNVVDLPDDEDMQKQMIGIRWKTLSNGRKAIETKEEMRRRGLKSPDIVDMLVIAFYGSGREPGDLGVTV